MLAVLPTGYGKSLIYQLLAPTYNFMDFAGSPGGKKSTVICNLLDMEDGSDDHDVSLDVPVEILSSTNFDVIYTHPDNKKVSKLLKTPAFIINIC